MFSNSQTNNSTTLTNHWIYKEECKVGVGKKNIIQIFSYINIYSLGPVFLLWKEWPIPGL